MRIKRTFQDNQIICTGAQAHIRETVIQVSGDRLLLESTLHDAGRRTVEVVTFEDAPELRDIYDTATGWDVAQVKALIGVTEKASQPSPAEQLAYFRESLYEAKQEIESTLNRLADDESRESEFEDRLAISYGEMASEVEYLAALLEDIGIDPELRYSSIDRALIRAQLAGCRVAGVRAG